jgi:hypothetical protein
MLKIKLGISWKPSIAIQCSLEATECGTTWVITLCTDCSKTRMMARWLLLVQIKKGGHLKNLEYVKFLLRS